VAQSIDEVAAAFCPGHDGVLMHDVEGYTHEEIAAELGITTADRSRNYSLVPLRNCSRTWSIRCH
jgi:hypothetical protein